MLGLVGQKMGMTRIFEEDGVSIPVTVVKISSHFVTQIKREQENGYSAIQVATGSKKAKKVSMPEKGMLAKAGVEAGRVYKEFRLSDEEVSQYSLGDELTLEMFKVGQLIDAISTSKGKGTAGVIKRWNFSMQDATHGNSLSHRAPGSIGQNQSPGRVFKGKKMAGRMGAVRRTAQSLEIVRVDTNRQVLLIKGSIPGAPGVDVIVKPAVKASTTAA